MSERDILLAGIAADPHDPVRQLAFADWLDEHGEHRDAWLYRVRCDPDSDAPRLGYAGWLESQAGNVECPVCDVSPGVRRYPTHDGDWVEDDCNRCSGTGRVPDGLLERAEFIRIQCRIAEITAELRDDGSAVLASDECEDKGCPCRERSALRRRERELLRPERKTGVMFRGSGPLPFSVYPGNNLCEWRRGFLTSVNQPWADWLADHAAILAHPDVVLREVRLTTWPEWNQPPFTHDWYSKHAPDYKGIRFRDSDPEDIQKWLAQFYPGHCPGHPLRFTLPGEDGNTNFDYHEADFTPLF